MLVKRDVKIEGYGVIRTSFFAVNMPIKYWCCMN